MTTERRLPTASDLGELVRALNEHGVEYAVIGGTAMMFHGFPRATRDIDLLLPLSRENNKKLQAALGALPFNQEALKQLEPESLDKGYPTAIEGELAIDILFVANDLKFDAFRQFLECHDFNGCKVSTLSLDGLIKSKETTRDSDKLDVAKLRRLRMALNK
ncbi:MAG: nucleotidyl transferase AbiEii/AbiGii toxin family protein [Betaproteobacteria bacterium]|jgi:hypothetical protein